MSSLSSARWLHLSCIFIVAVAAVPRIAFPFNSQVPPVARIGHPYSFTFSPTTFANDAGALDYSLQNAPAWLSIDANSRTLYGTPGSADAGFPSFSIIAFDATGRAPMPSTLVVVASDHERPTTSTDVSAVLSQGGRLSSPQTLLITPRISFAFSFSKDAFKSRSGPLTFYATLADHTPLPSWLAFDSTNLRMSGTAPVLSASPQYFDVLLIATDIPGFAATTVPFTIVVSVHIFHFSTIETTIDVELGDPFTIDDIRDELILDGQTARPEEISKSVAVHPPWLKFDDKTLMLQGKPPSDFSDGTASVQVWNRYGDIANKTLLLRVSNGLLSTSFPKLEATAGEDFEYTFEDSLFDELNLDVVLDTGVASSWLSFDPATKTLSGRVPDDLQGPLHIEMVAKTSDGSKADTRRFDVKVHALPSTAAPSSSSYEPVSTSSATGGVFAATGTPESKNTGRTAGVVIGVVIAALAAIGFLIFFCWYRRFGRHAGDKSRSRMKRTISRPQFDDNDPWSAGIDEDDIEKGSDEYKRSRDRSPQFLPKIPHISPLKKPRLSRTPQFPTIMPVPPTPNVPQETLRRSHARGKSLASSTIYGDDVKILDNINRSSWGYSGTRRPHDSMKLPMEMARQSKLADVSVVAVPGQKKLSRYASSTRLSLDPTKTLNAVHRQSSNYAVCGSVQPDIVGVGHGRSLSGRDSRGNSLQIQAQDRTPSYADSVTTHSTSVLFSPRTPAPPPRTARLPSPESCRRIGRPGSEIRASRVPSVKRPISRRPPTRSGFFSARAHSRGSSSSRHQGTILGLRTIHASPDPDADPGFTSPANGLDIVQSVEEPRIIAFPGSETLHPLRRNPTMTSEDTVTAWQAPDTSKDGLHALPPAPPIPERHPEHKRWSSQLKARFSRPISGVPSESSRFADVDDPPTVSGANVVPVDDDDVSVYSQSSRSVSEFYSAKPSPERERPVTRGKIPTGGVRVPPFTDPVKTNAQSIMDRPHPRVSIRKASREQPSTPQKRVPFSRVRGAENRLSGGGAGGFGLDKITLRPARLKSSKGKRPVSVNDGLEEKIRSVKGSVVSGRTGSHKSGRAVSLSPMARGNECFL